MKTIQTILTELGDAGYSPDEVQQQSTQIMRDSINTKLRLQGPPPPQVLAGLNTDHMLALFKWVLDLVLAAGTEQEREDAWHAFEQYRNWDITARHYNAYVKAHDEDS